MPASASASWLLELLIGWEVISGIGLSMSLLFVCFKLYVESRPFSNHYVSCSTFLYMYIFMLSLEEGRIFAFFVKRFLKSFVKEKALSKRTC